MESSIAPRSHTRLDAAQGHRRAAELARTALLRRHKKRPRRPLDLIHLNAGQPGLSYSGTEGCEPCVQPINDAEKTMATSKPTMNKRPASGNVAARKHLAGKA